MRAVAKRQPLWFRAVDACTVVAGVVGGIAAVLLMVTVVADVFGRWLLNTPLPGGLSVSQFVWMPVLASLGFPYALQRNEHIQVSILTGQSSAKVQRAVELVSMASMSLVSMGLCYFTVVKAQQAMSINESGVDARWLPIWPSRWVVAAGLAILALQALVQFLRALRDLPTPTQHAESPAAS